MTANKTLLILPGDGIGPEIMAQVRRVIDWLGSRRAVGFNVEEDLVGGAAIDVHGTPLTDAAMDRALSVDAVLLGAAGGPKWDDLPFEQKPERGLLRLRKEMGLFANLRPAICFDALVEASTLKPEVVAGLNIMIVRELTGGVYFGEPRGIDLSTFFFHAPFVVPPATTPVGACCMGETCTIQPEAICMPTGVYLGDNTNCDGNPCDLIPSGACCILGECSILTADDCIGEGGEYQGDDTVCEDCPCVDPRTGACCVDGECSFDLFHEPQ